MSGAASPMEAVPRLIIPAGPRFAGVGAEFVRGTALAGGIEAPLAERLALIAEEVVGTTGDAAGPVGLAVQDRRHAVRLLVEIARAEEVNLAGLDQSHAADPEDFEQVGLYLAARLAERLTTELTGKGGLVLGFTVPRAYPDRAAAPLPEALGAMAGAPVEPDDATLALLVDWAAATGQGGPSFGQAARVIDRRAVGDLFALAALDARRRPLGGLFWQPFGRRLMALSGPALLVPEGPERAGLARGLLEAALGALVRGKIQGLVVLEPSPDMPREAFEVVGHLPAPEGGTHPVLFRALEEDPGGIAWTAPDLAEWVGASVRRLGLGRDVEAPPPPRRATGAVMAAETDRSAGRVTLRPLVAARDAADVAARNVALFRGQGFTDIRAALDLGRPDQAGFAAGLLAAGLAPAALIPDAAGDLLLMAAA